LTKFVPAAMAAVPGSLPTKSTFDLLMQPAVPAGADPAGKKEPRQSLVCPADGHQLALDLEPVAAREARTYLFGPIDKKHAVDVALCEGQQCTTALDDKSAKSRLSLTPSQGGTLALLAEFSFDVGLWANKHGDSQRKSFGFIGQTPAAFKPIEGAAGPEQLFQMQQDVDPRNAFSTSLLLGLKINSLWFVGAGPSLFVGASGAVLKQWNAHFGVQIAANTYVTFGPSIRFVPYPDFYRIGDVVPVARPASGSTPPAPSVSSHDGALWQFDVGIGLDLAGAASALTAFGGK
jgi:hypothetical protein